MFFLYFAIIIIVLVVLLIFSTIKIEINNFKAFLPKKYGRYINDKYEVNIKLYILKKIRILKINITKDKLERKKIKSMMKEFEEKVKKDKNNFDIKLGDALKKLNIQINELDLEIYIGTEDAAITAISVGIVSSILGICLRNKIKNLDKQKFKVIPVYQDKNTLKIEASGIFQLEMIHIIYMLKTTKRRVKKNVRTSNRRSYAYSNE